MDSIGKLIVDVKIQKRIDKLQKRVTTEPQDHSESQLKLAWKRFKRNKAGLTGVLIIGFLFFIALIASPVTISISILSFGQDPVIHYEWEGIMPYNPHIYWDTQVFENSTTNATIYSPAYLPPGSYTGFNRQNNETVEMVHLLGTNIGAQDILSRLILGVRLTLLVAFGATIISLMIGIPVGLVSGFYGGKTDDVLMRITDIFLTLPFYLVVLLAVTVFLGNQILSNVLDELKLTSDFIITAEIIGFGLFGWMSVARLLRAEIFQVKTTDYVEAARALGASNQRIILRHILPNVLASLIIIITYNMAIFIITEAAVAFILLKGSGVTSWGQDIAEGLEFISQAWWPVVFPGIAITIAVIAFNLLGDSLRDAFDPRLR